ncbi:hypothetical protein ACFW04_009077 [Cataglyphis niger]
MISRNVSITLWKLITDLSCSAKNLYSCRQYLCNDPLSSKNNWDIKNYIISKTIDKKTKRKNDDFPHTSNMSYEDMAMRRCELLNNLGSPSSSLLLIKKIFEAMSSATADGSPTLSEARKIIDQQFEKSIIDLFLIANLIEVDLGKCKWCQNLPVLVHSQLTRLTAGIYSFGRSRCDLKIISFGGISLYRGYKNHWVHVDKPIEFIDVLKNFINRPIL